MSSRRQEKFNSLFQEELGDIFIKYGREWFGGAIVSITDVEFSPDLRFAKIYVSIMGTKDQQAVFQNLKEQKNEVKKLLGQRIGKRIRKTPDIEFYIDDSIDRAARIDELLKN